MKTLFFLFHCSPFLHSHLTATCLLNIVPASFRQSLGVESHWRCFLPRGSYFIPHPWALIALACPDTLMLTAFNTNYFRHRVMTFFHFVELLQPGTSFIAGLMRINPQPRFFFFQFPNVICLQTGRSCVNDHLLLCLKDYMPIQIWIIISFFF